MPFKMDLSAKTIQQIESDTGQSLQNCVASRVGGGCINTALRLEPGKLCWLVKLNHSDFLPMFLAEAQGLKELAASRSVRVPAVICSGTAGDQAFIVLEFIELGRLGNGSAKLLGQQLAVMHQQSQAWFGWHIDNTIGSTAQHNERSGDWVNFWRQQRLGRQLQFAAANGYAGSLQSNGEKLLAGMAAFFSNYDPEPALLHGDLWGGNAASDAEGKPVIFDPACYYGDRETDIAMTELFGGFGHEFIASYQASYPLDAGYSVRKTLYNLYHILNHLNLFGSSYLGQAENMTERLVAEL